MPKQFTSLPMVYIIVGLYRTVHDPSIRVPVWDKLQHGLTRGLVVASIFAALTFHFQRGIISLFLSRSSMLTNALYVPYVTQYLSVTTWATLVSLSSQMGGIVEFFLSKNIRIARDRAWDLTIASRGKNRDFWGPYIEEWQKPPKVNETSGLEKIFGKCCDLMTPNGLVVLFPLNLYPFVGQAISAYLRAYGTSRYLHKKYFTLKGMDKHQQATYMAEKSWDYRMFGFAAALLETFPVVGILFSVSNQVGAAMWAHDLEKRQERFRSGELKPLPPRIVLVDGRPTEARPIGTGLFSAPKGAQAPPDHDVIGAWKD